MTEAEVVTKLLPLLLGHVEAVAEHQRDRIRW